MKLLVDRDEDSCQWTNFIPHLPGPSSRTCIYQPSILVKSMKCDILGADVAAKLFELGVRGPGQNMWSSKSNFEQKARTRNMSHKQVRSTKSLLLLCVWNNIRIHDIALEYDRNHSRNMSALLDVFVG
jgi:hypothetical protein